MFAAGKKKKTYDLMTKDMSTGRDRINPNLSKKIKTALGAGSTNDIRKTKRAQREAM